MSTPNIPRDRAGWNILTIDSLIGLKDIERDYFDFKGPEFSKLEIHLCAMANTQGGVIVLGIKEKKNNDVLIGFEKDGFPLGKEDNIQNQIRNYIVQVEPVPKVEIQMVMDPSDKRFYPVIIIHEEEHKKPYMIKNSGVCYVRVSASSTPAFRETILRLFTYIVEKRKALQTLIVAAEHTKQMLMLSGDEIKNARRGTDYPLSQIDTSFLRSAALQAQWFLEEKGLLGRAKAGGSTSGFYVLMHRIERMNAAIAQYNRGEDLASRGRMHDYFLNNWASDTTNFREMPDFLDRITKEANEYLAKVLV